MDNDTNDKLDWEPYVWQGTLGGVIGNVCLVLLGAIYVVARFGTSYLTDGLVIAFIGGLLAGALLGLSVGFVIYKLTQRWGKQPNSAVRFAIGTACCLAFFLFLNLTNGRLSSVAFSLGYAILVGGFAGFLSRAKKASAAVSISAGSV